MLHTLYSKGKGTGGGTSVSISTFADNVKDSTVK